MTRRCGQTRLAVRSYAQRSWAENARLAHEIAERRCAEEKLRQYTLDLEREKRETDRLLRNIFPPRVVQDLREMGRTEPRVFQNVSVFFSDIVDFTSLSETLAPEALIGKLNEIFTAFDTIMEKNHCERIKTIGDAYLAVCGMPMENVEHACNITQAAMEILDYLHEHNQSTPAPWRVRIGIHSGPVVGGVVGVKKYIYDVFGDTVNLAKKLESLSRPMRVNVSEATYQQIAARYACTARGLVEVRGRGKLPMYFVGERLPDAGC